MTDTPTTEIDRTLIRLSEEDLMFRRRKTLQAIEKAKQTKGQNTAELERVLQALEGEYNRRQRNKNLQ
jgi:hypothetical protein